MKLLFLTNFYPPHSHGGYEEWCQEAAVGLRRRGHDVVVLTSRPQANGRDLVDPEWVRREFYLEMELATLRNGLTFFTSRRRREEANLSLLKEMIERNTPDRALIWGMWNLHRSLPALAERMLPGKVAYYLGDYWPTFNSQYFDYWRAPAQSPLTKLPKKILSAVALRRLAREPAVSLRFETAMIPSNFLGRELRSRGVGLGTVHLVPGGADLRRYSSSPEKPTCPGDGITILTAGRLSADKGIHTAIEALAILVDEHGKADVRLLVAGSGAADYERSLRRLAGELKVSDKIQWLGRQSKEALPALYHSADIFWFTSTWPEPFGRVIVEAMASGTAVVGACAGGAAELLEEGNNSLTFSPGNPRELAGQTLRLLEDERLRTRLAQSGRQHAVDKWNIDGMVNGIEEILLRL